MELKIQAASWHRNGIHGAGFYAILFTDQEHGNMVASLFDEPGHCAVYNVDQLTKGNITFGYGNSWRGDQYESVLRSLLKHFLEADAATE
jgi:hypothetical protein